MGRASASILCAAQVGIAHGSTGEHDHPRASTSTPCASQVGIAHGPTGDHEHPRASTSSREHLVRCTCRSRSCGHVRSRASTRAPCALHMYEASGKQWGAQEDAGVQQHGGHPVRWTAGRWHFSETPAVGKPASCTSASCWISVADVETRWAALGTRRNAVCL